MVGAGGGGGWGDAGAGAALLSHSESIALFKRLGTGFIPELKEARQGFGDSGFDPVSYARKAEVDSDAFSAEPLVELVAGVWAANVESNARLWSSSSCSMGGPRAVV